MGVLPLQFKSGDNAEKLELDATHTYTLEDLVKGARQVTVVGSDDSGKERVRFKARVRIDTPKEWEYYEHGGILHYVVRQLAA